MSRRVCWQLALVAVSIVLVSCDSRLPPQSQVGASIDAKGIEESQPSKDKPDPPNQVPYVPGGPLISQVDTDCASWTTAEVVQDSLKAGGISWFVGTVSPTGRVQQAPDGVLIYSELALVVDKVIAGPPPMPDITVWALGGSLDGDTTVLGTESANTWAQDGKVLGAIYPPEYSDIKLPSLVSTSVIDGKVIDAGLGCWDFSDIAEGLEQKSQVGLLEDGKSGSREIDSMAYSLDVVIQKLAG